VPNLPGFPPAAHGFLHGTPGGSDATLSVGIDLVAIDRMRASLAKFGERFVRRIFTDQEAAYAARTPASQAERLAARFAAKEAALKALRLADTGVGWKDMEVFRHPDGRCELQLHGKASELASRNGVSQTALSLSHDGAYASAIVVAVFLRPSPSANALPGE
jgi:holo-[acyl-carrier protein] synthase